jgi:hypothetical protein
MALAMQASSFFMGSRATPVQCVRWPRLAHQQIFMWNFHNLLVTEQRWKT